MGAVLNLPRRSLQLEVDCFMELLDPSLQKPMTKQAFSSARLKILPSAFSELFEIGVRGIFDGDFFRRLNGWRIFAIDGSELQLPTHGDNLPGFKHNSAHSLNHARASVLCDVLSGFSVHASIGPTAIDERTMAMEHLEFFESLKGDRDLVIFDRGYPSKELIKYLSENGFKYLMRVWRGFSPAADASPERDFTVKVDGCDVRAVKVELPGSETELLFTNLGKDEFRAEEFGKLYHLRWGAETKYNFLKNTFGLESFSGRSLHTVLQDFYATMYISNIAAGAKRDADSAIEERNAGKELKYEAYRTNVNLMAGTFKDKLVMILLEEDRFKRVALIQKLIERIASRAVPVIPGRSFPRRVDSHKRIANKPRRAL